MKKKIKEFGRIKWAYKVPKNNQKPNREKEFDAIKLADIGDDGNLYIHTDLFKAEKERAVQIDRGIQGQKWYKLLETAKKEEKERILGEIEKECREHIVCNKLGDTSRGEWVIGFHQGLHWVRSLLKEARR